MTTEERNQLQLIGEYETNIDSKGRVGLGRYRQQFGESVVAIKMDGYLAVMSPEQFSVVSSGIRKKTSISEAENVSRLFNRKVQQFKRHFYSNAFEVSLDAQGRMTIPSKMREALHLVKDVVWVGCDDMLELWQAKDYEKSEAIWESENGPEQMAEILMGAEPNLDSQDEGPEEDG